VRRLQNFFKKIKLQKLDSMIESQMNLPRITMIGHIHVYIENHHGIIRFTSQEIILNISNGQLKIKGSDLVIKLLLMAEILIEGKIDGIEMNQQSVNMEGDHETTKTIMGEGHR